MAQDYMRRAFKAADAMEPIALLDDYVKIISQGQTLYRKVNFFEAIPPFQWIDFCAAPPAGPLGAAAPLGAGTVSAKANVTNLDLFMDEFAQWRWFPLDNMQVQLFLPSGVSKWQLKNLQVGIDRGIMYRDPLLVTTEFFSWQDNRPAMQAMNFSAYALLAARVVGWGYRFHTTDRFALSPDGNEDRLRSDQILTGLQSGAIPCTPIQCAGLIGEPARS